MVLFYSLVSRGKTVLAECTTRSGNFPTVTRLLLSEIGAEDNKCTVIYDR
jgi:vesicle-associated membrane protein 7